METLYPEGLAVHFDASDATDGVVDIVGTVAGPAGISTVELSGAVAWEVDHAQPWQLVQLSLPWAAMSQAETIDRLVGAQRAAWISERLAAGPDGEAPMRVRAEASASERSRTAGSLQEGGSAASIAGRLIVAADMATDPELEPIVRVCGGVEFLVAQRQHHEARLLAGARESVSSAAADAAVEVSSDDLGALVERVPGVASRLESFLQQLDGVGDSPGALERLRWQMRSARDRAHGAPVVRLTRTRVLRADPDPLTDEDAVADMVATPPAAAPGTFDPSYRRMDLVAPGLLSVWVPRQEDERWVQVLRREGLVRLAVAPLKRDAVMDRAELVVPPEVAIDDLVVEVMPPLRADRSVSIEDVRAAVRAGRDAAALERLGHSDRARAAWERCARQWEHAEDLRRAKLASAYAAQQNGRRPIVGPPLLADEASQVWAR